MDKKELKNNIKIAIRSKTTKDEQINYLINMLVSTTIKATELSLENDRLNSGLLGWINNLLSK